MKKDIHRDETLPSTQNKACSGDCLLSRYGLCVMVFYFLMNS